MYLPDGLNWASPLFDAKFHPWCWKFHPCCLICRPVFALKGESGFTLKGELSFTLRYALWR
jgi:hypothetical protein